MENKLKVNVNMDGFIESISRQVDRLYEVSKILNGEDKKPSLKEQRINVRVNLTMDYIKNILIGFDERLLFIYFDELPVELSRLDKADIVQILEEKYGYNCKADNNGFFIERYNYIRKELEDMIGIYNLCESSEIIWDDGNSIYSKLYYDELTEDSYSCFVYDNYDDFIDDVLGLTEGNFIRTRELEDGFRMIVVKNVPNIDIECDDEE